MKESFFFFVLKIEDEEKIGRERLFLCPVVLSLCRISGGASFYLRHSVFVWNRARENTRERELGGVGRKEGKKGSGKED